MKIETNIILKREGKKPILIDMFSSENKTNQSIVIFCHGYKGFKDWGAWNMLAEQIAKAGFCFIKFNFSHNGGTMDDPIDFPDLTAFGNNNYTLELDDLNDVIDWSQNNFKTISNININKVCLIGHSRGGGIVILKTSEDRRITKLITLASVSDFGNRFGSDIEINVWKEKGVKYVTNSRTKQQMPHFYQFYKDFKANTNRLHIESAEKHINIPHLIIHGSKDTSVDMSEADALHRWNPKSKLKVIEGAGVRVSWELLQSALCAGIGVDQLSAHESGSPASGLCLCEEGNGAGATVEGSGADDPSVPAAHNLANRRTRRGERGEIV